MTAHTPPTEPTAARPSFARIMLSLEGATMFVVAILLYRQFTDFGWVLFAALLLAPDLAMLSYLLNKRAGMLGYNLAHTHVTPLVLIGLSLVLGWGLGTALAFIWLAHIGMDRTVGYGLKYSTGFKDTHLGRV
jgi:hypothetical protein